MQCLLETGAGINFQRKLWEFHHLQLDINEPDKASENIPSCRHEAPQRSQDASVERWGQVAAARPWDASISHKHSCTGKSLQSFIAFKNYLSGKVTAWPRPGSESERWQDTDDTPTHPLWSTGTLLPDLCHCCPCSALVVGSVVSKPR